MSMKKIVAGLVLLFCLAGSGSAGIEYGKTEFKGDVSVGSWGAVTGLSSVVTNATGGAYDTGSRTFAYRINGTNRLGRLPASTNHVVNFIGGASSNIVIASWPRYDSLMKVVIEKSLDGGTTWTKWTTVAPTSTNFTDDGTTSWSTTVFTNLYSEIPDPSVPWTASGDFTALSNRVVALEEETNVWNTASDDATDATNYIATNTVNAQLDALQAQTDGWNGAWSWVGSNSNDFDYVQARSSYWDTAYSRGGPVDSRTVTNSINMGSNYFYYASEIRFYDPASPPPSYARIIPSFDGLGSPTLDFICGQVGTTKMEMGDDADGQIVWTTGNQIMTMSEDNTGLSMTRGVATHWSFTSSGFQLGGAGARVNDIDSTLVSNGVTLVTGGGISKYVVDYALALAGGEMAGNLDVGTNRLYFGSDTNYWFQYITNTTRLELRSADIDGAGTEGVVFNILDGGVNLGLLGDLTATGKLASQTNVLGTQFEAWGYNPHLFLGSYAAVSPGWWMQMTVTDNNLHFLNDIFGEAKTNQMTLTTGGLLSVTTIGASQGNISTLDTGLLRWWDSAEANPIFSMQLTEYAQDKYRHQFSAVGVGTLWEITTNGVWNWQGGTVSNVGGLTMTGDLGVGTDTPATLLDINGITTARGAIILEDDASLQFDATTDGMADDKYNGLTMKGLTFGETCTQWDTVFMQADGKMDQTDADTAGEFPAWGICVAGGNDTDACVILTRGVVRNEGWTGLTVGGAVYLSDTAGGLTQMAPSTSGDCVQIIGRALSDSEIYFNFSGHWLEVE